MALQGLREAAGSNLTKIIRFRDICLCTRRRRTSIIHERQGVEEAGMVETFVNFALLVTAVLVATYFFAIF